MIKNQKQAGIAKQKLEKLKKAKLEFEKENKNKNSAKYRLGVSSLDSLIKDLEGQLQTYYELVKGNLHVIKPEALEGVSDALIQGRLAQKMSQKDLADILGLKVQQIQRYEATDYESASWSRIVEISMALKMKFYFEKTIIINESHNNELFNYPDIYRLEQIREASDKIRHQKSIIIN